MDVVDPNLEADDDNVWLPDDVDAKKLDTKERNALGSDTFAVPGKRKLPINDANHVRNALARFNQTKGLTPAERATARAKIHRAAKKFGIDVKAEGEEIEAGAVRMVFQCKAVSLDLPRVDGHPNRMPFSGILTRIDVASDKAPHGSNGKRIILTKSAAEAALDSLLGMGVDLKKDFDGHDAQNKVGLITAARIDGDAIRIEGFIYASDFPREALRIHMDQADLGFSFEAQNLAVESLETDPLVIKRCVFTGAAILLRNDAAYQTTALAAARAKEHEMEDLEGAVGKAVPEAIAKALEPITKALADIAALQTAQAASIDQLRQAPALRLVEANAAMCAMVEPHAQHIEAAADGMENNNPPIGVSSPHGHVHHLRRLASHMRSEAGKGHLPAEFHGSDSYYASADPNRQQQTQSTEDDDVKVQDAPEFKALQASAEKTATDLKTSQEELKKASEMMAVMNTTLADIKAEMQRARPSPDRKTVAPEIAAVLARVGLSAPDDETGQLSVGKLDAALAGMPNMDTSQRMYLKTQLARAGVIPMNGNGNGAA